MFLEPADHDRRPPASLAAVDHQQHRATVTLPPTGRRRRSRAQFSSFPRFFSAPSQSSRLTCRLADGPTLSGNVRRWACPFAAIPSKVASRAISKTAIRVLLTAGPSISQWSWPRKFPASSARRQERIKLRSAAEKLQYSLPFEAKQALCKASGSLPGKQLNRDATSGSTASWHARHWPRLASAAFLCFSRTLPHPAGGDVVGWRTVLRQCSARLSRRLFPHGLRSTATT